MSSSAKIAQNSTRFLHFVLMEQDVVSTGGGSLATLNMFSAMSGTGTAGLLWRCIKVAK